MRKFSKRSYTNVRNRNMLDKDRERNKRIRLIENVLLRKKKKVDHLTNCVKEQQKVIT